MISAAGRLVRSFRFACQGVKTLVATQRNIRIHLVLAAAAVGAGVWFRLSKDEWLWVLLGIVIVLMAEAFNSAIEFLCDRISPDFHPLVKKAKDTAAAGVLMAAMLAVAIGIGIFGPRVIRAGGGYSPIPSNRTVER